MHASESTVLRVLTGAGLHLPGAPPREPRPARPRPQRAELVPGVIWICDFTHFTRSKRCAIAIPGVVSRYWPATVVSARESSARVEVAFTRALTADGKEHLPEEDLLAELASGQIPGDDDRLPVLAALSGNGPQMTSKATAAFMARARIARHFGRPSTPNDRMTRPGPSRSPATSRASSRTWKRSATAATSKPSWTGCACTAAPSGCTRPPATSRPTTSTTAAARQSAPPAAHAPAPPAPPGLRPAARHERITREPPPVAGYFTRELVHFLRRTSVPAAAAASATA